ncbi:MAG: hypothetical protein GY821_18170 [Gammaproteobacteria bacterium]|nr:hypothetical protein [Gammaproteobacteria bacterium]
MKVAFFSTKPYEEPFFHQVNQTQHDLIFLPHALNRNTSQYVHDCQAVCVFVNDTLDAETLDSLYQQGVQLIALRCAGYNNVDLSQAEKFGLTVVRVPAYSPYAVAEHATALILALNRKIHRAYNRVRELDFSLHGLMGFDLFGKTVGVIGTGKIGAVFSHIMAGFGCRVIAYDIAPDPSLEAANVCYTTLEELFMKSGIVKSEVRQSHSIFLRMFFENIQPVTRHYGAPWGAY